jgi:hypothetical protein
LGEDDVLKGHGLKENGWTPGKSGPRG